MPSLGCEVTLGLPTRLTKRGAFVQPGGTQLPKQIAAKFNERLATGIL